MKKGDFVLAHIPFTDLTGTKIRPGLVLANVDQDVLLALITSKVDKNDNNSVFISTAEYPTCGLRKDSVIKLDRMATLDKSIIIGKIGTLPITKLQDVNESLRKVLEL